MQSACEIYFIYFIVIKKSFTCFFIPFLFSEDDPVSEGPGAGGCFNTGAGRLDVTEGELFIPPSHISLGTCVFILRVEKGIRRTLTTQKLTVIDGNPVTIYVGYVPTIPINYPETYQVPGHIRLLESNYSYLKL